MKKKQHPIGPASGSVRTKDPRERFLAALEASEVRYRRLFESAQDGILILNARSGMITDVNPYLLKLLGRPQEEFLGKKLWEIGLFQDIEKSKAAFKELQQDGYIRYEDLPLETGDGRYIDVEFVSNSYMAGGVRVIQCNIRDITDRKHAEVERAILDTTEKEQRRIGHDLHDGLCQQLTGAALIAKTLSQKLLARQPDASAIAGEIVILINQAIRQTRDVARGLAPVEVEAAGLAPALEKFASKIERGHGIECVFIHDKSAGFRCRYAPFLATHLYRIVQEAVSNAIEHGKARHIVIKLATDSDQERGVLTIEDDGSGFDLKLSSKSGLGLRSMRYRGRMIGARLRVSRAGTQGMIVTCSFPHHHTTEAESS